jgi:hypothetical protein
MKNLKAVLLSIFFVVTNCIYAQNDTTQQELSNLQNYTPSKLLENGKWDIKWFNNLYTQTREEDKDVIKDVPRSNYFASSIEIFTGVTTNKKVNLGFILDTRSNTFGGQSATSVFGFKNEVGKSRTGLAHFAPSLKIAPFNKLSNFSIQSSFFIPLHEIESNENGYLAEKSFIWQNRFFYDYTFESKKFQLFAELSTRFFFGEKGKGYANNSLELVPGAFVSYFASSKFTLLVFAQQEVLIDLGNKYSKNYTALGLGAKYQLTSTLNIETLYGKFVRGNDTGLGQSFNLGLRAIF